ncbi:cytochrome c oxidase subunit I [Roseinatronobacter bogoriensis]|uniref:cytochrome-c oxidase n=1 Tax=Roseinatronobacter bogoriensis subsp. barguzinensis TaxID=441209 RepID=A0A2K8K7E2_9RHOB|nr:MULTISPECIES: cytochrome c oxidase subunit I [Rhodobaca]ATX65377.1 cytochrome c oxidase subunit I [Rhodobaca barguzinensis]MBB4208958.1 cytochrome c oxidase subunit I+III [Rhodobaca bogoriensis DSM 18756]TDW37617.1 cytochrome c oxidase subunit I+III [Rhodobaca barguzinensis]TDY68227.1 cytochrome c oxidase subunit I+III [Rhodobaca bogoriensis DSM 18756]
MTDATIDPEAAERAAPLTISRTPPRRALALHRELTRVWRNDRGLWGQITAVNHTTLGLRFMGTALVFFAIGGILSMLIRAQLATHQGAFLDTELYNQIFTMHGSIMMFLFAIPMLEGLGIWLLPKLLGTRDMAFPRLTALGYWCYLFGGLIMLTALLFGVAPHDGWFMYTPLSDATHSPGINADVWLLGVTFVEISAIAAAVEITVTILRQRAPGMRLTEMPLFAWYMLGTSVMMLVGFPPLIAGSVLLELERAFGWPFFDPTRGGDPLLWQHLFWLFGHPEVYIIFLPAAGAMSMIIPVMCRTTILGYGAIVAAILALVFLSFGLWVHHMFTVGIPHMALAFFSAASVLVAVPTAVQVFAWIGTMWKGHPQFHLPMYHILGFFLTFVMGGLTGVMLAIVPFNWQAHDTAFVTAHLHYVLIGGFVFPMMAAATYWLPLITGKRRVKGLGEAAFWVILLGFHGTFFIMHLTGLLGMPRRVDVYPDNPEWVWLNLTSSIFSFVLTIGFAMFVLDLILQVTLGKRESRDPWRAPTLDWAMPIPSPSYNFASLPIPQHLGKPARDIMLALARGEGALAGAPRGRRELLVTSVGDARPHHVALLPGNTALPLWLSASIGVFVLMMLASQYLLAGLSLMPVAVLIWIWARGMAPAGVLGEVEASPGVHLPVHHRSAQSLGRSGLTAFLVADGTLFASLMFGVAFLSVVTSGVAPPVATAQSLHSAIGLAAIGVALVLAARCAQTNTPRAVAIGLGSNLLSLLVLIWLAITQMDDPTIHARDALRAALAGYAGLHVLVAACMAAFVLDQFRREEITPQTQGAFGAWRMWQRFTSVVVLISVLVLAAQAGLS